MKVVIASDHGGYQLKEELKAYIAQLGHEVADYGTHSTDSVDYPDFAFLVAEAVAAGAADRGIMIDGIGSASGIVANKVPGVRAAVCADTFSAGMSRAHNDANMLTLGARVIGEGWRGRSCECGSLQGSRAEGTCAGYPRFSTLSSDTMGVEVIPGVHSQSDWARGCHTEGCESSRDQTSCDSPGGFGGQSDWQSPRSCGHYWRRFG